MASQMTPEKKLHRSSSQKMLAGVCGGLAEYLGIDVMIIRLAFVVAALLGSAGIWLYVILWIVLKEEPAAGDGAGAG